MRKKILPAIKKDIKHFLLSEEGKVSRKNIIKIGMCLVAVGSFLVPAAAASWRPAAGKHSSSFFNDPGRGGHSSHASHGSHGSHGNHGSGGWC